MYRIQLGKLGARRRVNDSQSHSQDALVKGMSDEWTQQKQEKSNFNHGMVADVQFFTLSLKKDDDDTPENPPDMPETETRGNQIVVSIIFPHEI